MQTTRTRSAAQTTPAETAAAHIAAVVARHPPAAAYDPQAWAAAVVAHLEPLPINRAWRRLSRRHHIAPVSVVARAITEQLTPHPGHRPQPRCPSYCFATHADDVEAVA